MSYQLAFSLHLKHPQRQLRMHFYTPGIKLKLYQIKATNVII